MDQIEVIMPGSPVTIGEKINATVLQVCITDKCHVTYQCAWFDGNTRCCQWLEQIEVTRTEETAGQRIGFATK